MATVTASITVSTTSQQTPTGLPGNVTPVTINQTLSTNFQTSGTAADSVNLNYVATLSLAAAVTTIDLTSLTDRYGAAVNFARVRSVTIKNNATTDTWTVIVKPGASNGWTNFLGTSSTAIVGPSTVNNVGCLVMTSPNTTGWVVDGTHKTLAFDPGANTFTIAVEINGANV